jgi:YihY family inner membrane protein
LHIINEHIESQVIEPILDRTRKWHPTLRYLAQTEVHVYALSIAASVMLSLYPFLTVMASLLQHVFKSEVGVQALWHALYDFFPHDLADFIQRNLSANLGKPQHARFQAVSVILLLLTANGVFEPLEVALNRAWGAHANRTYLRNQAISFGLIIFCGGLVIASAMLTAVNQEFLQNHMSAHVWKWVWDLVPTILFKIAAIPLTMLALFFVYWVLPNCRVPIRPLIPVSIAVGAGLEVLKYVGLLLGTWLDHKLENEYGVFQHSVEVILFSMVASFIVLAGAEWTARHARRAEAQRIVTVMPELPGPQAKR